MKKFLTHLAICSFLVIHISSAQTEEGKPSAEKSAPSEVGDPTFAVVKSPDGKAYFPKGKESDYTRYYRAAELPSLLNQRAHEDRIVFRLAMIPSFTKPLFLTYYSDSEGAHIEVKRLSLRKNATNSPEPGKVELSGKITIGKNDAKRLEQELRFDVVRQPLKKLTNDQRLAYQGLDGCTWILEVATDKDYTMEDIWSPKLIGNIDPKILAENNLPKVNTKRFIEFYTMVLEMTDMKPSDYITE